MKTKKPIAKNTLPILTLLFSIPLSMGYTARTGISPLNRAIEMISELFNISVLQNNQHVQMGFLKFMLFIVLFAVSYMALKKVKVFDNKTAGIVSFAFSMIGVFMMPASWLLGTGGLITLIMSSTIFLGFFVGLGIVAVFVLRKKGEDDQMGWIKNLLGIILLLLLLFLLDEWAVIAGLPTVIMIKKEWVKKAFKFKKW